MNSRATAPTHDGSLTGDPEYLRGLAASVTVTVTEGGIHTQELRVK